MDLTELMPALENAIEDVAAKKATLDQAQGAMQAAIAQARTAVDAASEDYQAAVQTARALRQQLDVSLNISLPAAGPDGRVRQG